MLYFRFAEKMNYIAGREETVYLGARLASLAMDGEC